MRLIPTILVKFLPVMVSLFLILFPMLSLISLYIINIFTLKPLSDSYKLNVICNSATFQLLVLFISDVCLNFNFSCFRLQFVISFCIEILVLFFPLSIYSPSQLLYLQLHPSNSSVPSSEPDHATVVWGICHIIDISQVS